MADAGLLCFHCGEPLAGRADFTVAVSGALRRVCCPGCRAAAEMIGNLGLDDFYRFRTAVSRKPDDAASAWRVYDDPVLLQSFTRDDPRGRAVVIMIDGLTCAACSWLVSRTLERVPGVGQISVNTATGRAQLVWDPRRVALSALLETIAALGYRPQLVCADAAEAQVRDERRSLLRRLAVAGLGMMQVMMFAIALYAGEMQGMDADVHAYLRLVSLLVATPVLLYGGWPYFRGAAQALARRAITMDVPVTLGLLLAYGASVIDTWRHAGAVYFDSVTMFIFFLTVARYVEMVARHRSTQVSDSLSRMLPATAHRLVTVEGTESVVDIALSQVAAGDRLLIRAGEVVPADGTVMAGASQFNESMLTGESLPIERTVGDRLTGGTLNLGAPVRMQVSATGPGTVLAGIVSLLTRAQAERPRVTRAGDAFAGKFLARVLIGAAVVCAFWCIVDPSRAFAATLAVLIVACPCAFSLAPLVAVASANAALARRGVLVRDADAIEALARTTRVVFDKTGTLTDGAVAVSRCTALGGVSEFECLRIAAALEMGSEHPIARAFSEVPHRGLRATNLRPVAGSGVTGTLDGRTYRIGTHAFAGASAVSIGAGPQTACRAADPDDAVVYLSSTEGLLAAFSIADAPRPESARVVGRLHELGLTTEIQSGDSLPAVRRVALHCGIRSFGARRSPAEKLERVRALTAQGEFVAMVGDGMNDAPVLGGAGVSLAMSRGSALTLASADLILVGDTLRELPGAFLIARRAMRVMRQNLVWAAGYNLLAMPLAAMGWVPPWVAAIGMSTSSIVVVLNALRLLRAGRPPTPAAHAAGHTAADTAGHSAAHTAESPHRWRSAAS